MAIQFFSFDAKAPAFPRTKLKSFIQDLFKNEGRVLGELSYIFCSDDYLLNINRQFLNHDYYTDIITFDISENSQEVTGEIYISIERVKDNAKHHDQTIQKELLRVIFHGALHLCGYKDKTKTQQAEMRQKEDYYLERAGQL
jgi:probable rRNA maturation factor